MRKVLKKLSDKLHAVQVSHYFTGAPINEVVECNNMLRESTSTEENKKLYVDDYVNTAIYLHTKHEDFEKVVKVFGEHEVYVTDLRNGTCCMAGKIVDEETNVKYHITFLPHATNHSPDYYGECDVEKHIPMRNLAEELYMAAMGDTPWDTYHAMQLLHWGFENRFRSVSAFTGYLKEHLPYHEYLHLEVKVNAIFNIASYEGIFSDLDIKD